MKPTTKAWLTEKDIWNARLLAPCKSLEDVTLYIERHLLSLHPKWCREAPNRPGEKQYRKNLFEPGAIARWRASAAFLDHARETGLEERLIERKRDGKPRQIVKVKKPQRQPDGVWLTTREVYQQRRLGEGRSLSAVRSYVHNHRLAEDSELCRKIYGREREFHISLFTPEAMAKRAERRGWERPARQGNGEWLTAEEIWEAKLLGEKKSLAAVKLYIQRYSLSDHPKYCRLIEGQRTQLEYHVRLFTPELIAKRRKYRAGYEKHEPRGFDVLCKAEAGQLIMKAAICAAGRDYPSKDNAAFIRERCIETFGQMVMKDKDPAERVRIPPMRVFLYWLGKSDREYRDERRMQEQNAARTASMKQIAEERRQIVEARRQERQTHD